MSSRTASLSLNLSPMPPRPTAQVIGKIFEPVRFLPGLPSAFLGRTPPTARPGGAAAHHALGRNAPLPGSGLDRSGRQGAAFGLLRCIDAAFAVRSYRKIKPGI